MSIQKWLFKTVPNSHRKRTVVHLLLVWHGIADYAYDSYSSEILIKYTKTRKGTFGFQIQYRSDLFQTRDM